MKNLMLLLTFTVVSWTLTINASAKTIVTDGLVSYWTFDRTTIHDRTVEDIWGENDATIVGNPKVVRSYLKQGLELDGLRDYVSLPNVSNFGSRVGPYTFEAWFKTNQKRWSAIYKVNEWPCRINNSGYGILINAAWTRGVADHILETKEDFIMIERNEKTGGGCAGGSSVREISISNGEWHHIVYTTRKPTQEELTKLRNLPAGKGNCLASYVYINSEPFWWSVSCTSSNDIRPYTLPIFLGAVNHNGKASGFFQGVFDEVRIYDRALTEEEVIRNYESGIGLSVEPIEKLPTVWGALKARR